MNTLTIPSIILTTIEAAGIDASSLGFGVERLNIRGLSWVLIKFSMQLDKAPSPDEKIEIETWISDCRQLFSTRSFILRNSQNQIIGSATSQWCMINLEQRKAVSILGGDIDYAQHIQNKDAEITPLRRIPAIDPSDDITISEHIANEGDIDFNQHVNTIRYIEMMFDMLPQNRRETVAPIRLDLHFASESRLGDTLTIKKREQSSPTGNESLFEISRVNDKVSVKALFEWL